MEFKDREDKTKRSAVKPFQLTAFGGDAITFSRTYNVPPEASDTIPAERTAMPGYAPPAGETEMWWPYISRIRSAKQKDGGDIQVVLTFVQIIPAE